MNFKVLSHSETSTFQGSSSSSQAEDFQYSVPFCSMCTRKEKSVSYCASCLDFLCSQCDYSHKVMKCFRSHRFVSISFEDLQKIHQNLKNSIFCNSKTDENILVTKSCELHLAILIFNKLHSSFMNGLTDWTRHQLEAVMSEELLTQYDTNSASFSALPLSSTQDMNSRSLLNAYAKEVLKATPYDSKNLLNYLVSDKADVLGQDQLIDEPVLTTFKNDVHPYDSCDMRPVVVCEPSTSNLARGTRVSADLLTINPDRFPNANHVNTMQTHQTFGQKGHSKGYFNSPHGFCLGLNEDIVVADSFNHRIQIFDKFGCFRSQFGVAGRQEGYLWYPRKIAFLRTQRQYVICDRGYERSRMQIFTERGIFIKKVPIKFIDVVAGVAVTPEEDIVVVDSVTPTVFILGKNSLKSIDCTSFMEEPSDLVVLGKEIYICDFKANRVVVIDVDGNLLRKFGDKNTTMFPNGIDVSLGGYVVVSDSHGNYFHLVIFLTDGTFIAEYRCPYIKVSRCCCLKITEEKRLVTVDKNYHHAIIFQAPFLNNH